MNRQLLCFIAIATLALADVSALAAVPPTMTHQGRLFDAAGAAVNGSYNVTYSIYASPSDTTALWSEIQTVTFANGYYSANLGSATPFPYTLWDGTVRYLGVKIGTDAELSPRSPLQSVPHAFVAGDVHGDIHPRSVTVGATTVIDSGGNWVGSLAGLQGPKGATGATGPSGATGPAGVPCSGCVDSGSIASGAVTGTKIAAGTVQKSNIAAGALTHSHVLSVRHQGNSVTLQPQAGGSVVATCNSDEVVTGGTCDPTSSSNGMLEIRIFADNRPDGATPTGINCFFFNKEASGSGISHTGFANALCMKIISTTLP